MKARITHSSVVLPGVRVACDSPSLTGIAQLRYAPEDQKTSDLVVQVLKPLRHLTPNALVVATTSPDSPSPSTAHRALAKLEWPSSVVGFDVSSSCTSFLSAVGAAVGFLGEPNHQACVVAAELKHSQISDDDLRLKRLFGDGAAGMMLQAHTGFGGFDVCYSKVRQDLVENISVHLRHGRPILYLDEPKRMYREILRELMEAILSLWDKREFLLRNQGIDPQKAPGLIFVHQANARLLQDMRERLPHHMGVRLPILMSDIGNTVSASLPILRTRSLLLLARLSGATVSQEKIDADVCYVTQWRGEQLSVLDKESMSCKQSWLNELSSTELAFFKEIVKTQSFQEHGCDLWVSAGGGFQTLGILHSY